MEKERLDKLLAGTGTLSRKDVKEMVRRKCITLNGETVTDAGQKIDISSDTVCVDGTPITLKKHIYIMLNKPAGIVSASNSKSETTVVDLVPEDLQRAGLFPAGRLDKDTTGFVLITDDGVFAHRILSPKNHIEKTYIATLQNPLGDAEISVLERGLLLRDGTQFLPAQVKLVSEDARQVQVKICEGKYHQIKRMFSAVGNCVTALCRTHMGALELDSALPPGACRELTPSELEQIALKPAEIITP